MMNSERIALTIVLSVAGRPPLVDQEMEKN